MLKRLIAAIFIGLLASSVGSAADMTVKNYLDPEFDWDGFYVALGVGGSHSPGYFVAVIDSPPVWVPGNGAVGLIGAVGVNSQHRNFVVGGQAAAVVLFNNLGTPSFSAILNARAGVLATDDALIYGLAGVHLKQTGKFFGLVGAGVEVLLSDDTSVSVEYHYTTDGITKSHAAFAMLRHHL